MADILDWPREWYSYASSRFYLSSRSQGSRSPWSGRNNVYGPHAQFWVCEIALPLQVAAKWMPIEALLAELGGVSGRLRIFDHARVFPAFTLEANKTLAAEPWADGTFFDDGSGWRAEPLPPTIYVAADAALGDKSVVVGGLPVSTARVLRRNDLVEFRRSGVADQVPSLHAIRRDAPTDANGKTRIEIMPPLRKGLGTGDMAVLEYPTGVFGLADNDQGIFERQAAGRLATSGFKLIESIEV